MNSIFMELEILQKKISAIVETELDCLLEKNKSSDCGNLLDAMRYTTLLGGKRIRPFLVMAFYNACIDNNFFSEISKGMDFDSYIKVDKRAKTALRFACSVEMIHTYSLIHDDLPSMDNDDIRRNKPTNHKVFGDAVAILAGDALLTYAFETISNADTRPENIVAATRVLSECAGKNGMVGGQILDIESENKETQLNSLLEKHRKKTGALICAACKLGCIAAGKTDDETLAAAENFAYKIGIAFQIIDDILDVKGDISIIGKHTGKDKESGKTTFMSFFNFEEAENYAKKLTCDAVNSLDHFNNDKTLIDVSNYLLKREK